MYCNNILQCTPKMYTVLLQCITSSSRVCVLPVPFSISVPIYFRSTTISMAYPTINTLNSYNVTTLKCTVYKS